MIEFEKKVRDRFKHIIDGDGLVIPRIAVKIAIDDIFKETKIMDDKRICCGCGEIIVKEIPPGPMAPPPYSCGEESCDKERDRRIASIFG